MAGVPWTPDLAVVTGVVWGWPWDHGSIVATRAGGRKGLAPPRAGRGPARSQPGAKDGACPQVRLNPILAPAPTRVRQSNERL